MDEKTLADLGLNPSEAGVQGSKTKIVKLTPPPQRKPGHIVEGETPQEKTTRLVTLLHEEAKAV